jgi:3-oxoacyl-[acyl-carrier-protein] synthase III
MKVEIAGIAYYLPERIERSSDLKRDNPDWRTHDIESKTGVLQRHIAASDQTAADLAVEAALKLFDSGVSRQSIDGLIFVTQSPDYTLPTTACIIQARLELPTTCLAFDVNQGCSGYVYGLAIGGSLVETGIAKRVLLLCGETYSKYIKTDDRTSRPLFSDGAAATLLTRSEMDRFGPFDLGTDGSGAENLIVRSSGARVESDESRASEGFKMKGSEVFMFTMGMVPKNVRNVLGRAGKAMEDVDLFVFHQASKLVLDNIARHLQIPSEKLFTNYQNIGNTVSATIPIALKDASDQGRLKKGDTVMLVGFGVGYSWGSVLVEWGY